MTNAAQHAALRLAFACFIQNMTCERFMQLSMEQQIGFAQGNARLTPKELIEAIEVIGEVFKKQAAALRRYRDSHGHG